MIYDHEKLIQLKLKLTIVSDLINDKLQTNDVHVFLKLYLLLYADDIIIMAESAAELQDCLNTVSHYCDL